MYKTIVCAIEATKEGKDVLAKAVALSELYGAKLHVINVIPYQLLPKDYQKELKEKIIPKMTKITSSFGISKKFSGVKFGKPYEQICELADKKKADLIILGTHSKKGIKAFIGSTANGVVNHASCDVTLFKV